MVVAYLRGVLRKPNKFGILSEVTEAIVLEGLQTEIMAGALQDYIKLDEALIPAMKQEGIHDVIQRTNKRIARITELRGQNLYKVSEAILRDKEYRDDKLSVYQLYELAEKSGIFDAFDEHYKEEDAKNLI